MSRPACPVPGRLPLPATIGRASIALLGVMMTTAGAGSPPGTSDELFRPTKVWTLHLTFTPEQWAAMEPKGGPGLFAAPQGADGEPLFGPGSFYGPMIVHRGDTDKNGRLSRAEFLALADRWFARCDNADAGSIDAKAMTAGLNAALAPDDEDPMPLMLQGKKGKRNGIASALGIEFPQVRADLDFEGEPLPDVAIRYKGNGTFLESRGGIKRSFKIDLKKHKKGRSLAGVTTLNLHSNFTDASGMNESLAYRLYRDAGLPAPRTSYAKVYVTVPGKHDHRYFGLYSIVENVDRNFLRDQLNDEPGALLKPVTPKFFADLGDDWEEYIQTYDPKTDLTDEQKRRLIAFCRLMTKGDDAQFAAKVGDYLDLDKFARYLAVVVWNVDLDGILGLGQNVYVFLRPSTGKFEFIPWDQDHSFGQFAPKGTPQEREELSLDKPWEGGNRFLNRLFRTEAFRTRYRAALSDYAKTVFRPERFDAQIAELAAAIRPAVEEESKAKLAAFDKAIAAEAPPPPKPATGLAARFGGGMVPPKPLRPFVRARAQSVEDQLAGKSKGRALGSTKRDPKDPDPFAGFAPGAMLGTPFFAAMDTDRDKRVSRDEFTRAFSLWFDTWKGEGEADLTEAKLKSALNKALTPFGKGLPRVSATKAK